MLNVIFGSQYEEKSVSEISDWLVDFAYRSTFL